MTTFKDCLGREWKLNLTVGSAADIEAHTQVDLLKVIQSGETALMEVLFTEPKRLVNILWTIVHDQAEALKVDAKAFALGFDGETMERASTALLESICLFFPRSRVGRAMKEGMARALDHADAEMVAKIEVLDFKNLPGAGPASSASTPAPSP